MILKILFGIFLDVSVLFITFDKVDIFRRIVMPPCVDKITGWFIYTVPRQKIAVWLHRKFNTMNPGQNGRYFTEDIYLLFLSIPGEIR